MEAFEKWFEQEPTEKEKGYCMVAWRAALVWAKEVNECCGEGDGVGCSLREAIQQELDKGQK